MSTIGALSHNKPLTANGYRTLGAMNGVLNTDYATISLVPVGIDSNNVAKYRESNVTIAEARTISFSTQINGRKVTSRIIGHVPCDVVIDGITVKKPVTIEVKLTSDIGHSTVHRLGGTAMAIEALLSWLGADFTNATSVY